MGTEAKADEGDRIKLLSTSDPYTQLEPGDKGTVTNTQYIEPPIGPVTQVWVEWDNGSNLMLIEGEDRYEIIGEEEEKR